MKKINLNKTILTLAAIILICPLALASTEPNDSVDDELFSQQDVTEEKAPEGQIHSLKDIQTDFIEKVNNWKESIEEDVPTSIEKKEEPAKSKTVEKAPVIDSVPKEIDLDVEPQKTNIPAPIESVEQKSISKQEKQSGLIKQKEIENAIKAGSSPSAVDNAIDNAYRIEGPAKKTPADANKTVLKEQKKKPSASNGDDYEKIKEDNIKEIKADKKNKKKDKKKSKKKVETNYPPKEIIDPELGAPTLPPVVEEKTSEEMVELNLENTEGSTAENDKNEKQINQVEYQPLIENSDVFGEEDIPTSINGEENTIETTETKTEEVVKEPTEEEKKAALEAQKKAEFEDELNKINAKIKKDNMNINLYYERAEFYLKKEMYDKAKEE